MKKKINILFVCRYNRFRSRVAESYFKKINRNKNISVKSAGLIKGLSPLDKTQVAITSSKEFKLNIRGKPQGLSSKLLAWQNIIIIVANDVPLKVFVFDKNKEYSKKVIVWKIRDSKTGSDKKDVKRAIKEIIKKVDSFVKKLK